MRFCIASCVIVGSILGMTALATDSVTTDPVPNDQQDMIDNARQAYVASVAMYDVGAGGVTLESVYLWSKRWAETEADGALLKVREKSYLEHRERMSLLKDKMEAKHKAAAGGEVDKYFSSIYYLAEAESLLRKCVNRDNQMDGFHVIQPAPK